MLCANPEKLVEYTSLMNELGFFHLTLCADVEEAKQNVKRGRKFDYLLYDGFEYGLCNCIDLKILGERVQHIVLLAEITGGLRSAMFRWAWLNQVPLLGLLPRPINASQLESVLSFHHEVRGIATT